MFEPEKTLANYYEFCETLWKNWLADAIAQGEPDFIRTKFDLDAAPEPYLIFGTTDNPLIVLTTNPGGTMEHQLRESVGHGNGPLNKDLSYHKAAASLGQYYSDWLGGAAKRRIASMRYLADKAGYTGVVQVESIPFHSTDLPGKEHILRYLEPDQQGLLPRYVLSMSDFIRSYPVVIISAVASMTDLDASSLSLSKWLTWQVGIAGISIDTTQSIPLGNKNGRTTVAALVDKKRKHPAALILTKGSNNFPKEASLGKVAEHL